MGKNKLKKFAEMETFTNVVQSPMQHPGQADHELKGKWNTEFFKSNQPLTLELGCGKGEYSVSQAKFNPLKNFIGVDIKGARMWKGAKLAVEQGITNVGFLRTSIEIIDKFFAEGEVQEIWITFPDPQMKSTRRRLTATNFMEIYRRILAPGGIIHLKTDSNFQYQYTLEMVKENGFEIVANTDNLYQSELLDDVLSIQTFYEKQWRERGIDIKYLAFKLNHNEQLREPDVEIEKDPYRSFGRSARE
ncbi:tRNA (guanosine(46)-N7)-methyltransferase TrmB [Mangrovibacterium diazotrophicum]|uniref:tRNA (guanosine(46)-N7)-methyltransferase TrmB n=1 Tax=Mangrovibacterium diazotrophicum TaxID=1261403 RepID=UPI000E751248|nr:tRNA (guanosine(46)-N7)-methyltransferase TrmB [Mangrovibacterium diazotrophicum]